MQGRPFNSPIASLMLASEAFSRLEPTDDVAAALEDFQAKAWSVIELSNDPSSYTLAWSLIDKYAQNSLLEFLQGNVSALDKLKERIRDSIELMP